MTKQTLFLSVPLTIALISASAEARINYSHKAMAKIDKHPFGKTKAGVAVDKYTLTNASGASASVITYGATLISLIVPDKSGALGDVVLGCDTIAGVETQTAFLGASVGRYANRIAKGHFTVDGHKYTLPINNAPNTLHGGPHGYDKRVWHATSLRSARGPSVRFTLVDHDGEMGFPGNVRVTIVYTLTDKNVLRIDYKATTDKATPINLTNHAYWNLKDGGNSEVMDHVLQLNSDSYTPVDATLIPTGKIATVKGTPFDFTSAKTIGKDLMATGGTPVGYDHNFVLRGQSGKLALAATMTEPTTGRKLEVWTTQPGVQFYTGNFLDGTIKGKHGVMYKEHNAFCLETQHYPDTNPSSQRRSSDQGTPTTKSPSTG